MIVFRDLTEVPEKFGPSAVAIGKFDGVHRGHRAVIAQLRADAAASGARAVVVTFDRNPLAVLRPEECPRSLVDNDRKLELLAELGLDAVVLLCFDEGFATVTAEDFVRDYLVAALGASSVQVGRDFRFGHGGAGTTGTLEKLGREHGFALRIIDDVVLDDSGQRVSSSGIRRLLDQGDVRRAAEALGRPVELRGTVEHGLKRGRELGFPTANLLPAAGTAIPADGVYAGWLHERDSDTRHPAAISVGTNPTFDDVHTRQVEAHVPGRDDLDLYGREVTVEFVERLRGMVAYEGAVPLIAQMRADVAATKAALGV